MVRVNATPEQRSVRLLRVGEQVRHTIAELLLRQHVHDDVLTAHSVSVSEVRMSPDLRHATVFIRPLMGQDMAEVLQAMRANTAYFQREVAHALKLKYAAKLRFIPDTSLDEVGRIDRLLDDPRVKRDLTDDAGQGD